MKKVLLILIMSILMLSVSGCTDEVTQEYPEVEYAENLSASEGMFSIDESAVTGDLVPTDTLPENYELLGVRDLSAETIEDDYVPVEGIVEGSEGLYTYMESADLYIDVIETDDAVAAEKFITEYKAEFSALRVGDRFTDVSINEHSAVQILDYVTMGTEHVQRYTYVWNNDRFVFVVGGTTEDSDVLLTLAESIGY